MLILQHQRIQQHVLGGPGQSHKSMIRNHWLRRIERRGALEHPSHVRDAVDAPRVKRLVERRGATEHRAHVPDASRATS